MAMILTSRRVSAREGRDLGFVHEVVHSQHLMEVARNLARQICTASPMAIRASKEVVLKGLDMELPVAIKNQFEFPAVSAMWQSADTQEGPKAFVEKRKPRWQGC